MTSVLWGNDRPFLDGDKVRELLDKKGWTIIKLKDVAKAIGLSDSALSWCLSGNTRLTDKRRREIIDAVDKLYKERKHG